MFGVRSASGGIPIGGELTINYTPALLPTRIGGGLFDVADHRIVAQADYPRLFAKLGQAWRLPGDTFSTATHFRFPDGQRLRKGAAVTVTPASGLTALMGAPVIAGNTITFSGGLEIVGFPASTGKQFFGLNIDTAPAVGKTIFLLISDSATFPPTNYNQIAITNTGWKIYDLGGTPTAWVGEAAAAVNDDVIMYRDADTGAWGIIFPDGTDSGDLSGVYGGFTGPGYADLYMNQAGPLTINSATTGLTPPVGYTAMATEGAASITSTTGTRAGSTTSAAHALTLAELPAVDLPLHINAATDGSIGVGNIDRRTELGSAGTAEMNATNFARLAGGNTGHTHGIDPEHVAVLRLVRVA